jgi:hypothetical protein
MADEVPESAAPTTPVSVASAMAAMSLAPDTDERDRCGYDSAYSCNEFLSQGPSEPDVVYLVRLIHMISVYPACTGTLYANGYTFESALTVDRGRISLGSEGGKRKTPALPFSHVSAEAMAHSLDTIRMSADPANPMTIRHFLQMAENCAASWWQVVLSRDPATGNYVYPELRQKALGQQLLWMRYFVRSFLSLNSSGAGLYFIIAHGSSKRADCTIGVRMCHAERSPLDPVYSEIGIVAMLDFSMRDIYLSILPLPDEHQPGAIVDAATMRANQLCANHFAGVCSSRANPSLYEAGSRASDTPPRQMRFGLDQSQIAVPELFTNGVDSFRSTMQLNAALSELFIGSCRHAMSSKHPFYLGRTISQPPCDIEDYLRAWANRIRNAQVLTTLKRGHNPAQRPLEAGMYSELVQWVRQQGPNWRSLYPLAMDSGQTRSLFSVLTSAQLVAAGFVGSREECAQLRPPRAVPSLEEVEAANVALDQAIEGGRRKVTGRGPTINCSTTVRRKRRCAHDEDDATAVTVCEEEPDEEAEPSASTPSGDGNSYDEASEGSSIYARPAQRAAVTPFEVYTSPAPVVAPIVQLQAESTEELERRRAVAVRLDSRIRSVISDPQFAGRACMQVFLDMAQHGTPFYACAGHPQFIERLNSTLTQFVPTECAYLIPMMVRHLTERTSLNRLLKTCESESIAHIVGHGSFRFVPALTRPAQSHFDNLAAMFDCDAERDILMAWQCADTTVADLRRALLEDVKETLDIHLIIAAIGSIDACTMAEVGPGTVPFDSRVVLKLVWPALNWAFVRVSEAWLDKWPSYLSDKTTNDCGTLPNEHFAKLWNDFEKNATLESLSKSAHFGAPELMTRHRSDNLAVDPDLPPSQYCIPNLPAAAPFINSHAYNPFLDYNFDPTSALDGANYSMLFAAMSQNSAH